MLWNILLLYTAALVSSSKFKDRFTISPDVRVGPILEGPMYGLDGGFFGIITGTPYVGFEGMASIVSSEEKDASVNLVVFHTSSSELLPVFNFALPEEERRPKYKELCDWETGNIAEEALHAFGTLESQRVFTLTTGETGLTGPMIKELAFKSPIVTTGYQYVVFAMCSPQEVDVDVDVDGELIFRNPYGFLPARYYGYLPFLGVLSSVYLVLLIVFCVWSMKFRKSMLRMQWGILIVIIMGMVETTTWFLTYVVMNDSGETSCCPWRRDIVFAMFCKNLKQAVSALLVLATALGWGVVRPNLTKRTTLLVVLLGFFYLMFSVKFDLIRMEKISSTSREDGDESQNSALWAFPVALCDVAFILSIYFALVQTMHELAVDHQDEKLKMYNTLSSTLRLWGVLWFLFTIFDMLIQMRMIPFPWSLEFLLWGFWDVFYLAILIRIAQIWRPTETSERYAYSAQLPTDNVLDEFETDEFEQHSTIQEKDLEKS